MTKKCIVLALLTVAAALFALPVAASATPAHISETEQFSFTTFGATVLEDANGASVLCKQGAEGNGSFENTTTGTINLVFYECESSGIQCNSAGQPAGRIVTTTLPFHLVTLGLHSPGVLITPGKDAAENPHFATFNCTIFVKKELRGNGILGTITSPTCGTTSTTVASRFEQGVETGRQQHKTYTGTTYQLTSNGTNAALIAEGRMIFGFLKSISCTV